MRWTTSVSVTEKDALEELHYLDQVSSYELVDQGTKGFSYARFLDFGSSLLIQSVSSGYDMESEDECGVAFTVTLDGTMYREIGENRIIIGPSGFQLLFPSIRKTLARPAGQKPFRSLTYFTPMISLRRHIGQLESPIFEMNSKTLQTQHEIAAGAALSNFVKFVSKRFTQFPEPAHPRKARLLSENILNELLAELLPLESEGKSDQPAGKRIVYRAEEIVRANYAEPMAIADVANQVEVSVRSLQMAFMSYRGKTPKQFLSEVRLKQARARLLSAGPDESITDIALECGIVHLGRFSVAYRKRFGESPSKTLVNVRSI